MVCNDCDDKYVGEVMYCDCCERRIYPNQNYIMLFDGTKVCMDCADEVAECEECGLTYYKSSLQPDEETGKQCVCQHCRTQRLEPIDWSKIFDVDNIGAFYKPNIQF